VRILDPEDSEDFEILVQIALENNIPLKVILNSIVKINVSDEETLFNIELEELGGN